MLEKVADFTNLDVYFQELMAFVLVPSFCNFFSWTASNE